MGERKWEIRKEKKKRKHKEGTGVTGELKIEKIRNMPKIYMNGKEIVKEEEEKENREERIKKRERAWRKC